MKSCLNIHFDPTQNVRDFGGDRYQRPNPGSDIWIFHRFEIGQTVCQHVQMDLPEISTEG